MRQDCSIPDYLNEIISNFCVEDVKNIERYGSGHINETFYVSTLNDDDPDYLLQRINHHIFKDIPSLMENIRLVTDHLRKKLGNIPDSQIDKEVLMLVTTKDQQFYYCDEAGNYWRMYHFVPAHSYDILQTELQAYEGGRAFGKFQALLVDLDISLISETIPNFHNISIRLERFNQVVHHDVANRVMEVSAEISFIKERMEEMNGTLTQGYVGVLPLRIIHNDTKFNNVLLDDNDHFQCVIDLDTVMPGYVAYDFGDAIRTIINTAAEDEKDLAEIKLNIPLFEAYAKGYFEEAKSFLTEIESRSLLTGVFLITYEQIVRFLTDYLEGDSYYKIHFPKHNLQRARAQIKLLEELEYSRETLEQIMENIINGAAILKK